jgi:hypothetical protein
VMPNTHSAQRGGDPHLRRCVEMLHQMKMQFFASGAEPEAFHLRVAFPDDWPAVAEELKGLAAAVKGAAIASIVDRRWAANPFAQIADLFLAAVIADWEGIALNDGQRALRDAVVSGLGWEAWGDLRGDTYMNSWKFNIWTYHNPRMGLARRVQSRRVKEYTPYRADWVRKRR